MEQQNIKNVKAKYWILTIPQHQFTPYLPPGFVYMCGQLESGNESGYLHWQVLTIHTHQIRGSGMLKAFGKVHMEPSRSEAAEGYCLKEDTRVEGTQFTLGRKPLKRNNREDWGAVLLDAKCGRFDAIPPDILIRNYGNICKIRTENAQPSCSEKVVQVYWGATGVGKSRLAWEQATFDAYPKDPCTKFWDGYRGQENVVIDEFRGTIGISHLLRWLDRYPVIVEIKGSSVVYKAKNIWITSNLHPQRWYPDLDEETYKALMRRLIVTEIK